MFYGFAGIFELLIRNPDLDLDEARTVSEPIPRWRN